MARNNLAKCLPITLAHEGGMSMVRADPGNWTGGKVGVGVLKGTKYGIAASAFPNLDIKNLTLADVEPIYKTKYWDKVRGDYLAHGVDLTVFDFGVNSGPSRALKYYDAAKGDGKTVIQTINAKRMSFLRGLTIFKTFGKGWTRRVADIEAKSVAMYLAAQGVSSSVAAGTLKQEAVKADKTAANQNKGAAGTAAGGAGVGGTNAATATDPNWLLIGGIVAAVVIVATILILKSKQNKERAAAYEAAAVDVRPA